MARIDEQPQPSYRAHAPQGEEVRSLRAELRDADLDRITRTDAERLYEQLRIPLRLDDIEGSGENGQPVRDDYVRALEVARTRGIRR